MLPINERKVDRAIALEERGYMAEFYLYTDESGKLGNSPITSFCGYVAHTEAWAKFEAEWTACQFHWQVPPIHMAAIMHPENDKTGEWLKVRHEWGGRWDERRTTMLKEFALIVGRLPIVCVGNAVNADHFRQMPDSVFKREWKDPLFLSFHHVVRNSLDKLDTLSSTHNLSIVVDDDGRYSQGCYDLLNQMRSNFPKDVGGRIDSMCFANDKAFPALQAADMIAYETRSLLIEKSKNKNATISELYVYLTAWHLHEPTLYTPEFLDLTAEITNQQSK